MQQFRIGNLPSGVHDAITDVPGVRVGHVTLVEDGPSVARTGITAIHPLEVDYTEASVFAGFHRYNGFGEVAGTHWLAETGILTSPILLTSTFSIGVARDTLLVDPLRRGVTRRFHHPLVAETNDGFLNDGPAQHIRPEHVRQAIDLAAPGPVPQGCVGGGTGMIAYGFKAGIGSASRLVETELGRFTLGALVQANHGRRADLTVAGLPLGRLIPETEVPGPGQVEPGRTEDRRREEGSIIVVLATDAPLLPPQCTRLAQRAVAGLGRAGAYGYNGSGDFVLAFSTANRLPAGDGRMVRDLLMFPNDRLNPLLKAAAEVAEQAVFNALWHAHDMTGRDGNAARALPRDRTAELLAGR
ncbi:DmpA family aminopeptidase [Indioceanicola profundi]|uniref:DmpA family aminopeptidase n=1 Tax=Indioceanicola profundi TaxID=2220096 RepID=UPI000E6AAF0A|nr:P1 family peptidase [Indioceanicola profundi]